MQKNSTSRNEASITVELLTDKLVSIEGISFKKMFGGYGIFHEKKMFGIVDRKGLPYLKVGDSNRADFEKHDAQKHSKMSYYIIPEDVFDDHELFKKWVEKAIQLSK